MGQQSDPHVIVLVDESGNVTVETKGVSGPACRKLTAGLAEKLGKTVSDKNTHEFYQQTAATQQQGGG